MEMFKVTDYLSFSSAFALLWNPKYHLLDAFPVLCIKGIYCCLRGLVQTIFGQISVIVTLGGGGGGGGGGYDAKKNYIVRKYCFHNTEHLVSCSAACFMLLI